MLYDLDKIELRKTFIGISCPTCGGDLKALPQTKQSKWRRVFQLRISRVFPYRCAACGIEYRMSEKL